MEDLIGLTEKQWEELVIRYPEYVANLDADFLSYLQEIRDKEEAIKEAAETETEKWTGFMGDTLLDEFLSGLQDMDKAAEDFAEDFEGYLKNAVINAVIGEKYKSEIEQLVKEWESMMKSDGELTEKEVEYLKKKHKDITDRALADREESMKVFGEKEEEEFKQEASAGAFQTMSQETGDELNGRFTALNVTTDQIREQVTSAVAILSSISSACSINNETLSNILNLHMVGNGYLEDIKDCTRKIYAEFGYDMKELIRQIKNV
ncbi:hypothetical protein EVA_02304 [gut metagenome]|uniref:Uncharacterized protein n=1 Tax=gut metagenome TaxID=749906 RepID=J9H1H7_9ZZZZ